MLPWLLTLCTCCTVSSQLLGDMDNITVPAAGNALLPCGATPPPPQMVRWRKETAWNDTWADLMILSPLQGLELISPALIRNASLEDSGNFSCSVDDEMANPVTPRVRRAGVLSADSWLSCEAPQNWTRLSWSRGRQEILTAARGRGANRLHVVLERNESYLLITSVTPEDSGVYHCVLTKRQSSVRLYVTQTKTGLEIFFSDRYWIIVVATLCYLGFCGAAMSVFMCGRREGKTQRQAARFYKVSSASRNLYTGTSEQAQDADWKQPDVTYQNVADVSLKRSNRECYSDCSSFMENSSGENYEIADAENAQDGDSYLEPNATEEDQISDEVCYEIVNEENMEDAEQYENSEVIKDQSEGSQSYEDMMGSMRVRTTNNGEEQEEDTDSYENMQTPLYARPNHSQNSLRKDGQAAPESGGKEWGDGPTVMTTNKCQLSNELNQERGDFYLSFEGPKI